MRFRADDQLGRSRPLTMAGMEYAGENDNVSPADPALTYFRDVVQPTAAEFLADKSDRRRGVLACLELANMTEHYFHARPALGVTLADFKHAIRTPPPADGNAAIGWIADIANATKHVSCVSRFGKPDRPGFEDVRTERLNQYGVMRYGWLVGGREVFVGTRLEWRLSVLVESGMEFWRSKLAL